MRSKCALARAHECENSASRFTEPSNNNGATVRNERSHSNKHSKNIIIECNMSVGAAR